MTTITAPAAPITGRTVLFTAADADGTVREVNDLTSLGEAVNPESLAEELLMADTATIDDVTYALVDAQALIQALRR